jgi:hypothetical protein
VYAVSCTVLEKIIIGSSKLEVDSSTSLINELLPAEWFPIMRTEIFFLGASSDRPKLSAIFTIPEK